MSPFQRSRFQAQANLHSHMISLVKITLDQEKVPHRIKINQVHSVWTVHLCKFHQLFCKYFLTTELSRK